jgi:hypothetical protein
MQREYPIIPFERYDYDMATLPAMWPPRHSLFSSRKPTDFPDGVLSSIANQ